MPICQRYLFPANDRVPKTGPDECEDRGVRMNHPMVDRESRFYVFDSVTAVPRISEYVTILVEADQATPILFESHRTFVRDNVTPSEAVRLIGRIRPNLINPFEGDVMGTMNSEESNRC